MATRKVTSFPSLNFSEFRDACQSLETRCHDRLGGTDWQSVRWIEVVDNEFGTEAGELCIRQLGGMNKVTLAEMDTGCEAVMMTSTIRGNRSEAGDDHEEGLTDGIEVEDDEELIAKPVIDSSGRPSIDFSIVLSATYRVPVLWFSIVGKASLRLADLDEVYSHVVAPHSRDGLQHTSVMGGISIANHPLSDEVMFFIHPCNTPEALRALKNGSTLTAFEYLLLWFGVIASSVGLHIPVQVASAISEMKPS